MKKYHKAQRKCNIFKRKLTGFGAGTSKAEFRPRGVTRTPRSEPIAAIPQEAINQMFKGMFSHQRR